MPRHAVAQSLKVSPADIDWVICNSGADIWHAHPQPDGKSIDWKADEQWERHIDWRCASKWPACLYHEPCLLWRRLSRIQMLLQTLNTTCVKTAGGTWRRCRGC